MTKHSRRITEKQIFFSIFCFLEASLLFFAMLFTYAKQESWLAIIISAAIGLIISLPVIFLYKLNRGKDLTGICRRVLGRGLGTVISALYLVFFLLRLCVNISRFGGFISTNMLQQTPIVIILGFFVGGVVLCARRGAENLCGMSLWFAIIIAGYILLSVPLLWQQLSLQNLLPIFSLSSGSYFKAIMITVAEPFANLSIFLMLFDETEPVEASGRASDITLETKPTNSFKLTKFIIGGYIAASIITIVAVFRDNSIFGKFAEYITVPSFQAARLINVGEVLSRVELVYAVIFITTVFFRIALSLYCVSKLFSSLTMRGKGTDFVLPMGILAYGISLVVFRSHEEMQAWSFSGLPFYNWIFEAIIPLIVLTVCLIKKRGSLSEAPSRQNKAGKKLYKGTVIVSCTLTGIILFLLVIFNYQLPSPLKPLKWVADSFFKLF